MVKGAYTVVLFLSLINDIQLYMSIHKLVCKELQSFCTKKYGKFILSGLPLLIR